MKPTHYVTYIKLAPYLATYFRGVMALKPDAPLTLPNWESRKYFLPLLRENIDLYRNPATNDKGYFKDASSYTQESYELVLSSLSPDAAVTLDPDKKYPTVKELSDLQPFLLPNTIHLPKTKDKPERDVKAHSFFELHDKGVTAIRSYIRDMFYAELHHHILTEQRIATRMGKIIDISFAIETWLSEQGIISDDLEERNTTKDNIRRILYRYDEARFKAGDPDSIRRSYYNEMKKGHLSPLHSALRKKRTK